MKNEYATVKYSGMMHALASTRKASEKYLEVNDFLALIVPLFFYMKLHTFAVFAAM